MTYSRAISFRMISTRSIRAAASPARAFVPFGQSSARIATTFCSAARVSSTFRITATRRAILCGFPSDRAKISAATISAADSSEMVKSGWCFLACKGALQQLEGSQHGQAYTRKRKDYRRVIINHEGQKAGSSPAPFCCSVSILPRQTPQRPRRDFILGGRGGFTPSRASFPFAATDLHTPSKARIDHVAHLSALKSAPVSGASPT